MSPISTHELSTVTGGNKWTALLEAGEAAAGYVPELEHRIIGVANYLSAKPHSIRRLVDRFGIDKVERDAMEAIERHKAGMR